MTVGSGIAIAGIWGAVAASAFAFPPIVFVTAPCALLATIAIASVSEGTAP
jgi:hypothetical protein